MTNPASTPTASVAQYDVIVCGSGPSGAMAAATAAKAGLKVALLEKQFLPRHKTCGGGMPMVMQDYLWDMSPDAFVESNVSYMRHTWNFDEDSYLGEINPAGSSHKLELWMVQRPIFDNALAERAARAGAELRDGLAVRSLDIAEDGITVNAQEVKTGANWTAKARYVIGADGANGVVVKSTKLRKERSIAVALEVELPHEWGNGHESLKPEIAHLEYGAVKRGYGWIFPKADHLNIGAGLFRPDKKDARKDKTVRAELQAAIFAYMDKMELKYDPDNLQFHGHPLPTWSGKEPLQEGRILLVGDAAGLINPLFGDGLLHAVKSGKIAGEAIAQDAATEYTQRIHAEFATDFDAALQLSRIFYNFTGICFKYGVKYDKGTRYATELLAGQLRFDEMQQRAINRLKRSAGAKFAPALKLLNG
ncbi:geranylgeranyl reductase family protein [filamentous cyanobacterium LEGE 11480]|uniref:Geranylgeranyl reductase family protein n=1 Tax=Romeriopsis navalis LEGE 11480 TaxID=2777977 RepID=A0A928Z2S3_9CYAN|nr:geranylgeranyl reductase family protein [Romeriopsis navalis]MBE9028443.1 geranylgeranyl reductase family protein [Romeriopsis navalis LEGE 11480]